MAANTVIIILGKHYQWMRKLVGESLVENRVFTWSQSISPQDTYSIIKEKKKNSNFLKLPGKDLFHQGRERHHTSPDRMYGVHLRGIPAQNAPPQSNCEKQ